MGGLGVIMYPLYNHSIYQGTITTGITLNLRARLYNHSIYQGTITADVND